MVDPAFRKQEGKRQAEFRQFDAEHGAAFRRTAPAATLALQRVLVVSSGSLGLLVEIALVKAIQAAGYRPVILTDYDRWVDRYYRAAGVEELSYWEEWQRPVSRAEAVAMMHGLGSFEQFIQADYCGARVGKYAASTGLRHLRVGRLDLSSPPVREALLPVAALRRAEEVFLSSTGGGVIGISRVDGVPVAGRAAGEFGPVTRRLQAAYWGLHEDARFVETVSYD